MAEETRVIKEIKKNSRETVYIGLNQWKEQWYLFIRTYAPSPETEEEWIPTKKGISLPVAAYPVLAEAIRALGEDLTTVREAAVIEKSRTQDIRIGINEYKGMQLIYIRTFMELEGEKRPTQKGVSLKAEFYGELAEAVTALGEAIHN